MGANVLCGQFAHEQMDRIVHLQLGWAAWYLQCFTASQQVCSLDSSSVHTGFPQALLSAWCSLHWFLCSCLLWNVNEV